MTLGTAQSLFALFVFSATRKVVSSFYDFSTTAKDALESFTANMVTSTFRSDFLALVTDAIVTMAVILRPAMAIFRTVNLKERKIFTSQLIAFNNHVCVNAILDCSAIIWRACL